MQLERTLFSLYNFTVNKPPKILWLGIFILLGSIIIGEIGLYYTQPQPLNYEQCLMTYYNATRPDPPIETNSLHQQKETSQISQPSKQEQPKIMIKQLKFFQIQKQIQQQLQIKQQISKTNQQQSIKNDQTLETEEKQSNKSQAQKQIPFNLTTKYYEFLNKTTVVRFYLDSGSGQQVKEKNYEEGNLCRILLNVQDAVKGSKAQEDSRIKQHQAKNQNQQEPKPFLQNIKNNDILTNPKIQVTNFQSSQKSKISSPTFSQTLQNRHPFMHLTSNSHLIYLQQQQQFLKKHNIKTHAIILPKQPINGFPKLFGWISTKLWRFYGEQVVVQNQYMIESITRTMEMVRQSVGEIHKRNVQKYNEQQVEEDSSESKEAENKQSEKSRQTAPQEQTSSRQQFPPTLLSQQQQQQNPIQASTLPHLLDLLTIQPFQTLYLYFHYPDNLHYITITSANNPLKNWSIFGKIFFTFVIIAILMIISCVVGLVVRYMLYFFITLYLVMGGWLISSGFWGWIGLYFKMIRGRDVDLRGQRTVKGKMMAFFVGAMLGTLWLVAMGCRYLMENMYIYTIPLSQTYYSFMLLKTTFIAQLFFYIFCRSRLSLNYFPKFCFILNLCILLTAIQTDYLNVTWLLNIQLLCHIFLMSLFLLIEHKISLSEFKTDFTPTHEKPRSLYYAGYDLSWENNLPPIWTYFVSSFDLRYFSQKEKCLINRDYQLLYGRLLGMNQRQELPEDQENEMQMQEDPENNHNNDSVHSNQQVLIN